jgi:hypothetical protein
MPALMQIAQLSVIGCWTAFVSIFIIKAARVRNQRNAEPTPDSGMKTAPVAKLGIFIEGVGFFISYLPRPPGESPHDALLITAILLAPASVFLSYLGSTTLESSGALKPPLPTSTNLSPADLIASCGIPFTHPCSACF